ncbi:MAG: LmeA family phospholipid-binding protein [Georgenia sp.]
MRRAVPLLIVLLVLVAVGAVAADRYLLARAEQEIATRVGAVLHTTGKPDVTIGGFPFLPQVLTGEIGDADAHAADAVVEGLRLDDVDVSAREITLGDPVLVGELDLSATMADAALEQLLHEQMPALALRVTTTRDGVVLATELFGLPLTITAVPTVIDGALAIGLDALTLAGATVDARVLPAFLEAADALTVELPALPPGLEIVGVEPRTGGVRLLVAGKDVALG